VEIAHALDAVCARAPQVDRKNLEAVFTLAMEIALEGSEGRHVGTLFTIGRPDDVLASSRALILDPLAGHAPERTHVTDRQLRGTLKELAQLDGAFVVADNGAVVSACRYLDVPADGVDVPFGLGSRHVAAASISKRLGIVAVAVSASGFVRVFCDGDLVTTVQAAR